MRSTSSLAALLCLTIFATSAVAQSAPSSEASKFPATPVANNGARGSVTFEGGDGSSKEKAVVIKGAATGLLGVFAEYDWIKQHYPGYKRKSQALLSGAKSYDLLEIELPDGRELKIYFDISDFYGKGAEPPLWTLISNSPGPDRRKFVDLKTIKPAGNYLRVWTLYDADVDEITPTGLTFKSAKQFEELDCARGQGRVMAVTYFGGNMEKGGIVHSEGNMPTTFAVFRPTSMNENTAHVVCHLDTYLAQPKAWEEFGETDDVLVSIDRSAFRRTGSVARVRVMYDFKAPRSQSKDAPPIRSQIAVSEYDCAKRIHRAVELVNYTGQRAKGQVTDLLLEPNMPFAATPRGDGFAAAVCALGK